MSYLSPGLLEAYNSLTDKHLVGYFNNTRIRRHLRRAGLITRSGRIVPEKEYRQKLIHRAHQRHVRECLAQAIFHKVLDMERAHQTEIKKRLEEFARRERVYKIKVERSKRHDDDFIPMLSPRPPTGPRGNHTQQSGPEGEMSESSESPGSSRPNTAPGKMQRPVRLKPIGRNSTTASVKRTPSSSRNQDSSNDTDQPPSLDRDMRHWTMREYNSTVSPYRLPVINNFVTPVPPQTKRRERSMKGPLIGTRGRRLRPTTAPSVPANTEDCALLRTSMQSKVTVTMVYFGRSVHLSHDLIELGDEVKVFQQHCGGENLCVYKGRLREGETFQFISRRHRGFPFSLTFYLNGLQVDRLSSCCEFKHRKGSRLGGRHGHFGFFGVDGAQPCYKCIIVMGLDKKPTPPPKRASDDTGISPAIELCPETTLEQAEVQENQVEEKELETETDSTQPLCLKTEEEAMQDDQPKDDYEEDFEADDEGPVEDGGDGGDGKSPSPTNEGKMEDEIQDAPVGEQAEHKHPGSKSEDEDKAAQKETRSVSSEGASSCSGSDAENSEVEAETKEDDATEQTKASEAIPQADPETEPPLPMETSDKHQQDEDAEMTEVSSPVPPEAAATAEAAAHTEAQDCGGDNPDQTELEVSDSTDMEATAAAAAASASEGMADTAGGSAAETEPERAKSVQEKLAEAILNEAHSSPEPELSDTSTEEEEEESEKTPQDTTALEPETGVALSLLQPEKEELKECEKNPEEILNEETDVQASEERGPSPENKDNQGPDEQNVEAEEPEVENEKTDEQQEELEPIDECSKETLEISANPDGEKTEETESNEADETPCEAETKVETEDQDIKENAKEQTEESSTFANETESTSLENKEENAKEINETHDSEDPLEELEKEEEEKKNTEETAEGDPGASETEAQKTSEEPSESAMAVSGVPQSEEPSADDTKREEGTPDDQDGATDNGAAGADDATAYDATSYDATARDDGSSGEKSMAQEANYETSEKTSTTNVVGKENEENSDEKLVDGKKDQQDTEEKDKAEEEQPVNVDEGNNDVIQQISEYESEALDKEEKIVDELKEDKDRPLVTVENVETVQEQVKPDTGEQSEEDKAEEVAKETDIPEARNEHAENEVKVVEEDAKSSVSDGGKEKPKEDKNDTEDKVVDREERDSVSEGEKDKSVECEEEKKLDVKEHEGQEAGADLGDTPVEAKADIEDSPVDTIAEKDGGKVTDEEVDKPVIEQVNEREVETEPAEKEDEQDGEEQKKEKIQHEQDTEPKVSGDTTVAEDAEEDSVPKDGRAKVDDEIQTLKDTEVEEVEHPEKDTAEVVERDDTDRDVQGEDKHDVMFNMGNTIVHNTTVSGDGTESQHSMNAEAKDEVVEVKTKQTSVFEFAIRQVREQQQDDIEINDENGEKITASETIGNVVKTSEVQEFQQNIDTEQTGSSDRGEEKTKDTLEEIVEDKQNDFEDMNGDDTKSDRKLSSEGSAATQVKVEERKVNDGDDDHASVLSKTSKDNVSRHSLSKQDQDLANSDKQIEETSSAVQPFHIVQEAEGLNTINTNGTMSDTPGGTGSDLETKLHKSKPKDLEGKEDTSTKTDSREPDGTVKESKEDKVNGEQSVVESLVSPLPLELEKAGDLVSKWVNQHQSRGCFQTFVEPLDDMKETSSLSKGDGHINGSLEKGEGSQVTNMPDSDTLDQVSEKKEDYGSSPMSSLTEIKQETTVKDFVMETAEEKAESDVRSKHSNDESALATKDMLDEVQDEEIRDLTAETKYAKEDTTNITTKDKENQPYEQGVVSDRVIDLIAIMKTKDDSRADSESLPESASHAKTDNSVHSLDAQDTTMTKQQLRLEDAMPQSLSRDRLSTFSVEDSNLFGPTTYPRLATAHPEQSY